MKHVPVIFLALLIGCANKLETGYTPRKLNANSAERRAYYAPGDLQSGIAGGEDR